MSNKKQYVFTNNEDKLEVLEGFQFLRGIDNADKLMGLAKNKKGETFEVYTYPCSLGRCYCWATAKKIEKICPLCGKKHKNALCDKGMK